ncbi:MAG: hypothetical protein COA43_01125 [Robiginitomaculum sp.]|nr:MAG: hypothetical protein COA43_01125 [Robiginitomaculum sp.]
MGTQPKARADLQFQKINVPTPTEFDYSDDITDEEFVVFDKAMQFKSGLSKDKLKDALTGGIVISGDPW